MRAGTAVGITNWEPSDDNQYLDRLTSALMTVGITPLPLRLEPRPVLRAFVQGMRTVHVHWPEYLVVPRTSSRSGSARNAVQLLRIALALVLCKLLRVKIVWTVHNLGPHEIDASWAAFRAYELVSRTADEFVLHSHAAARRAQLRFPRARGRVTVAPHGHYLGVHPPARATRSEVRARYGIPSGAFLLLAFGQVRPYKRLVELSRMLLAAGPGEVHLLIAGAVLDNELSEELERISEASESVHLDLRRIPADQVSALYGASDAAVINYKELFSSGSLLLALSQGLPVISAHSEAVSEVADWPAISTYADLAGLLQAVERLAGTDVEARRSVALAAANAASWERAASTLREVYATAD